VIGDVHFVEEGYYRDILRSREASYALWKDDFLRYLKIKRELLPFVIREIKKNKPDFLLQVGDFVEGGCKSREGIAKEMEEGLKLLTSSGVPVFIAKGNHEGTPGTEKAEIYKEVYLSYLSGQMKKAVKNYYAFSHKNSYFIILDYLEFIKDEKQFEWLEQKLLESQSYTHVFIFAHPPLFTISRVFFTNKEFRDRMISLLEKYPVDAYFCGHTHNNAISVHKIGKNKLLQVMTTPIGLPENNPTPLEEISTIFTHPIEFQYLWGYLENTVSCWCFIEVDEEEVILNWHVLGKGVQGKIKWKEKGEIEVLKKPQLGIKSASWFPQGKIYRGFLSMSMYQSYSRKKSILFNGKKIGYVPVGDSFTPGKSVEVPPELIQRRNIVEIENPEKEEFCIGNIYLTVESEYSQIHRSQVVPYIYTTSHQWDNWKCPYLRYVPPGRKIRMEILFK